MTEGDVPYGGLFVFCGHLKLLMFQCLLSGALNITTLSDITGFYPLPEGELYGFQYLAAFGDPFSPERIEDYSRHRRSRPLDVIN